MMKWFAQLRQITKHKYHPAKRGGERMSEYSAAYPPGFTFINMPSLLANRPRSAFIPLAARRAEWHIATTGCQAQPHISQTLQPFGARCRRAAAMQLPIRFGRITHKSNPTQLVSLSLCFACAVPPDTAQREAPTLVTSYCAT